MNTLAKDLQRTKSTLDEFYETSSGVLSYLPNVINSEKQSNGYILCSSKAGTLKNIRPYRKELFIKEQPVFEESFEEFSNIINRLKNDDRNFVAKDYELVDRVIYTVQQSIGIGLDLTVESNSARKHVSKSFEELIKILLHSLNVSSKKIVLSIPYETRDGERFYRCETDVVISPYDSVKSDSRNIDPNEIVISLKTTAKDRMPKIFIDKILMERFLGHPVRVLGISQNDIQRRGSNQVSFTFVSNLFMVYRKFLAELEGYYYLDPPNKALEAPFNQYVFRFSKFLLSDLWKLLRA